MSTHLPRKLEQKLRLVGEQIRLARLRRKMTIALVADRAQCSELTVMRVEKGLPSVAIGTYLRVLWALQLADDIDLIAKNDPLGQDLQDLSLPKRRSHTSRAD